MYEQPIRIGTIVNGKPTTAEYIRQILPHGFESFAISFWEKIEGVDLPTMADEVKAVLDGSDAIISSLGVFGNPMAEGERGAKCRAGWELAIDHAHFFGTDIVSGFTGRVVDTPIDQCITRYVEIWEPLAARAADRGVRIAFENCEMGGDWRRGDWNIAHSPDAWELMFDALPLENIGLEWEPCHQMVKLIDPMPQLRAWVKKMFHIHGKDATVYWDVVKQHGVRGPKPFAFHRTPGFGDSNWTDIISELRRGGFTGCIDIEGWHDPIYRADLEMTGQVHGLNYLKGCRTRYVANPTV